MRANHEECWVSIKTGRSISSVQVLPGQFIFGRKSASKELDMDESTIYKRMQILKKHKNLTIESNTKYSIISIVNWECYQSDKIKSNSKGNKQVTSKSQASNTDNNDNNDNKDTILSSGDDVTPPLDKKSKVPYQDIVNLFNEILPELPEVRFLNDTRKKILKGRWLSSETTQDIGWWRIYFEDIKQSDFLMGRKTKWQCDFDWIIKPSNFVKIREGNYVNR